MGLERLWEFLQSFISLFQFWAVLNEYEEGVIFTLGRPARRESGPLKYLLPRNEHIIGPGFHFVCPFGIEGVVAYNKGLNTEILEKQDLTTKDGARVSLRPAVIWRVHDVYKLAVDVEDDEKVLYTHIANIVAETVLQSSWAQMCDPEWWDSLGKLARKAGFKYGVEVVEVGRADQIKLDFAGRIAQ